MTNVVAAFAVAWLVPMIYLLTLSARQRRLERDLQRLADHLNAPETN